MPPIRIPVAQQHIPEAHVDDIVLSQRFQQLLSLHIITTDRKENIGTVEHGDILLNGFPSNIAPFDVPLVVQYISNAAGRIDAADVGAEKQHNFLKHCLVGTLVAL